MAVKKQLSLLRITAAAALQHSRAAYATATLMLCFCCPLLLLGRKKELTTVAGSLRVAGTLVAQGAERA
jgi:hypothetical protein